MIQFMNELFTIALFAVVIMNQVAHENRLRQLEEELVPVRENKQ
jgi:hypothetical protein